MNGETNAKKGMITAMIAVALLSTAGGAYLNNMSQAHAQSVTTTPAARSLTTVTPAIGSTDTSKGSGTFHSNEDPTHEAGESAAREAQETAGQR